jgi:hypothetical protein
MKRENIYVLLPLAAIILVYLSYIITHPYPALGGGLYLMMAETISQGGYSLPSRIPYYTPGGIPFGYPPLMFYIAAFLLDIGIQKLAFARFFPIIPMSISLVIYTYFATKIFDDYIKSSVAATVIATSPAVFQYTLTAGGFVRATGLLFTTIGLFTAIRAFRENSWYYTFFSVITFTLIVATHLKYALFFGTSCIIFYIWFNRTVSGLIKGICIASGGLLLTAPWWFTVGTNHGFDIFLSAGSTHGGVGSLFWIVGFLGGDSLLPSLWPILVAVSGVYLVAQRQFFLPVWFLTIGFVVGNDEHLMLVGSLMVVVLLFNGIIPSIYEKNVNDDLGIPERIGGHSVTSIAAIFFITMILIYSGGSSVSYMASNGSSGGITFIDGADVTAMEWAKENTQQDVSFVIIGDASEWFPLFSHRTSIVAARGSEWNGQYGSLKKMRSEFSNCLLATCVSNVTEGNNLRPDYVYVARDGYGHHNNRALMQKRWELLPSSMEQSPQYERVYRNDGVILFRYDRHNSGNMSTST